MKKYKVAVVGVGAVGIEMLKTLENSSLPISEVVALVRNSVGRSFNFRGQKIVTQKVTKGIFKDVDIALFSAGGDASRELAPIAVSEGAVVIDNSSAFRMDDSIPLIVPEVNPMAAKNHNGLISNPNCSTIQMVVALKPLHDLFKIKRVVVSTYQAVSGTGYNAIQELNNQVQAYANGENIEREVYPHQIAFNALPHIDTFLDNGYSKEEMKMYNETMKIMEDDSIQVTATTVRIPVMRGHSESINIETEKPMPSIEEIERILSNAEGIKVINNCAKNEYPMPIHCENTPDVYVGRLRKDYTIKNGLNMWVVADNLLKGAAYNAVQIAELLVKNNWLVVNKKESIAV